MFILLRIRLVQNTALGHGCLACCACVVRKPTLGPCMPDLD
jgi:hypothetical protein